MRALGTQPARAECAGALKPPPAASRALRPRKHPAACTAWALAAGRGAAPRARCTRACRPWTWAASRTRPTCCTRSRRSSAAAPAARPAACSPASGRGGTRPARAPPPRVGAGAALTGALVRHRGAAARSTLPASRGELTRGWLQPTFRRQLGPHKSRGRARRAGPRDAPRASWSTLTDGAVQRRRAPRRGRASEWQYSTPEMSCWKK